MAQLVTFLSLSVGVALLPLILVAAILILLFLRYFGNDTADGASCPFSAFCASFNPRYVSVYPHYFLPLIFPAEKKSHPRGHPRGWCPIHQGHYVTS